MASSSEEKRVKFVKQRLDTPLTEKATLYDKIDQHVKMVEERTKAWMKNPVSSMDSYLNICSLLETAVDSLSRKSDCFSETDRDDILQATQYNTNVKTIKSESSILNRLEKLEAVVLAHPDVKHASQTIKRKVAPHTDDAPPHKLQFQEEMENFFKDQNLKFEPIKEQLNEQSQSIKLMGEEIVGFYERENNLNKEVERLSQIVGKCKTNSDKINTEMQVQTDKTLTVIEEIQNHSEMILAFQRDGQKLTNYTESQLQKLFLKCGVMCQLMQQRLVPMDKLIQTFNRNQADKPLPQKAPKPPTGVRAFAMPQMMNPTTGFIASHGHRTKYSNILSFTQVESNVGNHLNPSTGFFKAPSGGSYMVVIAIRQTGTYSVNLEVNRSNALLFHRHEKVGDVSTRLTGLETSETFVVGMNKGDTLWAVTDSFECECIYFSCLLQ